MLWLGVGCVWGCVFVVVVFGVLLCLLCVACVPPVACSVSVGPVCFPCLLLCCFGCWFALAGCLPVAVGSPVFSVVCCVVSVQ